MSTFLFYLDVVNGYLIFYDLIIWKPTYFCITIDYNGFYENTMKLLLDYYETIMDFMSNTKLKLWSTPRLVALNNTYKPELHSWV